ncbi:glycosyl transferase [Vibrio scophthalmi]|uniref:glycosyl transferase n=1 Tax=Vibrio scophthalmi TaxID=45658 RepID=UPI003EB708BE
MKFIKRYLNNAKRERQTLRKLNSTVEYLTKKQSFHSRAMTSTDDLIDRERTATPVVVSFTTYSKRIHDVYLVIESLGYQTVKANKIVLWLDQEEFSLETLPILLHKQIERGLEIKFCNNIRSYKKLIPSLKAFPDADIITVDDDFLYPHDLIESLLKEKPNHPDTVIGIRSHCITHKNGNALPYKKWGFETSYDKNGKLTFLTTGAGTLFPAGILDNDFCDEAAFMSVCPFADDIWVNFMCIKKNISRVKIADDRRFRSRFLQLEEHQDIALNNQNVHENQNDLQVKAIVEKYNISL